MSGVAASPTGAATPASNGEHRRLALNFIFLAVGEFVAKLITFATFSYLARTLLADGYGNIEFSLAVMVFFTLPADLGLGAYGAREIAKNRSCAAQLFRDITGMRLLLALCSFAALLVFIAVIHKTTEQKLLLTIYGVSLLAGPFLLQWFFQAHDLMHWVALASIVRQAVFAATVFLLVRAETPLAYVGSAECVSVTAVAIFSLVVTRGRMAFPLAAPQLRFTALKRHLWQAMPIGLTELAWAFMFYFATVVLGLLFADESLGWFGASHRILMALHTFVWLYFFNLLPSLSRCVSAPAEKLRELINRSMRVAGWTSVLGAFSLSILAREILTLVYGPAFAGASRCFAILAWLLPIAMMSGHHRYTLIAYGYQTRLLWCTGGSAVMSVLLGLVLVPLWGATGAALALLGANLLHFAAAYYAVKVSVTRLPVRIYFGPPLAAMLLSTGIFYLLKSWTVWMASAAALTFYLVLMAVSQGRYFVSMYRLFVVKQPVTAGELESQY